MSRPDHRPTLTQAYANAAAVTTDVQSHQLAGPTPCPDYDVATLVDHLVGAGWRAAALGRGESPSATEFPHVELTEAPEQLRRAAKEAESAWADDARLEATVTMPWGETYTGATLVDMYTAELAAHAWDLAASTGDLDRLDPALARPSLEAARAMLKPEYRDLAGKGIPYGAEVAAPSGATDWERLAAFMGRDPRRFGPGAR